MLALALAPTSAFLRGLQTNTTTTNFDPSPPINTTALALCLVFVFLCCFLPTLFHCAPRALKFTEEQAALHEKHVTKSDEIANRAAEHTAKFKRISASLLPQNAICAFAGGPLPHTILSSCQGTLLSMFDNRRSRYNPTGISTSLVDYLTIHPEITYAVLDQKRQQKLARYATAAATATAALHASEDASIAANKLLTAHGGFESDWHRKRALEADALDAQNHTDAVRHAKSQNKPPPPDLPKSRCDAAAAAAADSIHAASRAHNVLVATQLLTAEAYAAAQASFAATAICKNSCCRVCPSPCCKPTLSV